MARPFVNIVFLFITTLVVSGLAFRHTLFKDCSKTIKYSDRKKLVIDNDSGADDAMAIFMALLSERYFHGPEVVALTTTYGNVDEKQSFENTQRILNIANRRDIPIYRGSNRSLVIEYESDYYFGQDGLGDNKTVIYDSIPAQNMHAVVGLIELSKKYREDLILLSIGPLTNVALAIRLDPEFLNRISQLYVAAGYIYNENNTEPEFNAAMDVEAYRIVADAATANKVTVITFGVVQSCLNISKEWRQNVLGAIPTTIMQAQNVFEQVSLSTSERWKLLDPAAAAVVLDNEIVEKEILSNNSIILHGPNRGVNTNDFESKDPNVKLVYSLNKDYYKNMLFNIFSAELRT